LNEVLSLDRTIREDVCTFLLGFGHNTCFYREIENAVRAVGRWDWFLEERDNVKVFREYVRSADGRAKE
jgi:hypothetical protein